MQSKAHKASHPLCSFQMVSGGVAPPGSELYRTLHPPSSCQRLHKCSQHARDGLCEHVHSRCASRSTSTAHSGICGSLWWRCATPPYVLWHTRSLSGPIRYELQTARPSWTDPDTRSPRDQANNVPRFLSRVIPGETPGMCKPIRRQSSRGRPRRLCFAFGSPSRPTAPAVHAVPTAMVFVSRICQSNRRRCAFSPRITPSSEASW